MTVSCHDLDGIDVTFDDERAVPDAGLLLPATLAAKLGLRQLVDATVRLAETGRANAGIKAMTVIMSILVGGDCIDDVNMLRAGGTVASVLGHGLRAASTIGTFLRAFTWGHVSQLTKVSRELLQRAYGAGAGPGAGPVTVDIDSTICETYGLHKIGGSRFTYTHVRGYHPLIAVVAGWGDVIHSRLRGGPAHTARAAASFIKETVGRLRHAGVGGQITLRADSGYYSRNVIDACRQLSVRFSVTVRHTKTIRTAITKIADDAWRDIPYWIDGGAQVAECAYRPFGAKGPQVRLIVRRVQPTPGSQLALLTDWGYHAFITDRTGDLLEIEADHRRHAEIENVIRDLKYGCGLNHMPSGRFDANAAWLELNIIAHNLARWTIRLGDLADTPITLKTLRGRYLKIPGRLTRPARRPTLHLPTDWPWADRFLAGLHHLRELPSAA